MQTQRTTTLFPKYWGCKGFVVKLSAPSSLNSMTKLLLISRGQGWGPLGTRHKFCWNEVSCLTNCSLSASFGEVLEALLCSCPRHSKAARTDPWAGQKHRWHNMHGKWPHRTACPGFCVSAAPATCGTGAVGPYGSIYSAVSLAHKQRENNSPQSRMLG